MKRVLLLSPLLLITAITLDRVIVSSAQISIVQSLRSLFIMLFFLVSATLVIQYFLHDWHHTHFLVLMIPVTLVAYR
ncbi:MAG TPA: hypothetical protein VFY25_01330, partial [Anaerolineales bacterium]|nr:hypothetical protein [Anaerolineales bacterium]